MKKRNELNSMKRIDKQEGWTMWGLIFSLMLVVFFGYIIMQLVPVYTENSNIKRAMDVALDNSGTAQSLSKSNYTRALRKQLYIDGNHNSIDYKDDIMFKRKSGVVKIDLDYERIVPLFFNISLKLDFRNTVSKR